MFAHCVLPALLLLATIDYSTSLKLPPNVTNKFEGDLAFAHTFKTEKFFIRDNQCYGILHVSEQPSLRCLSGLHFPSWSVTLNVTVYDFDSVAIKFSNTDEEERDHVVVTRKHPCSGKAIVEVAVGCESFLKGLHDHRKVLSFLPLK